jgi:branched-chain amino acid transport system ATP-binding protein
MRREEDEVMPMAREALLPEDWAAIDASFASNNDPVVGVPAQKAFRELFRRLAAMWPE